jgi:hypothetical protein
MQRMEAPSQSCSGSSSTPAYVSTRQHTSAYVDVRHLQWTHVALLPPPLLAHVIRHLRSSSRLFFLFLFFLLFLRRELCFVARVCLCLCLEVRILYIYINMYIIYMYLYVRMCVGGRGGGRGGVRQYCSTRRHRPVFPVSISVSTCTACFSVVDSFFYF